MGYFDALILGIIEGITEFLPISSTGHLILVSSALNISSDEFLKSFEIIIQLGAILAVLVLYGKTLIKNFELVKKVLVAFLPTAIIGLLFYKIIKTYLLGNNLVVILSLFIGGVVILIFDRWERTEAHTEAKPPYELISYKQAFWVGVFQAVSVIPGISRSAATIIGGRLFGISRIQIVEFSFLLAIPTMAAASGLDILKNYEVILEGNLGILVLGFIVSFIVALFAIKFFLAYVKKHSFAVFGWYRIIISVIAAYFLL